MSERETIVRYVIHPGLGIARVGNSPDEFFIGPEAPGVVPRPEGGFKDVAGRVKRQAARFRGYGVNAADEAVREIDADCAQITWRIHLANRKAIGYQFLNALDLGTVRNEIVGAAAVTIWADLDGSVDAEDNIVVDMNDYNAVKKWLGFSL